MDQPESALAPSGLEPNNLVSPDLASCDLEDGSVSSAVDLEPVAPPATGNTVLSFIQHIAGYLLAIGCLGWVLHDIEFSRLTDRLSTIKWQLVILAAICDILSYLCQGLRWRLLLKPIGNFSLLRTTQAVYVGLFTNEVVPMHLGEVVRAYLVSRWGRIDFTAVLPTVVTERLFDGIWLAIAVGLTVIFLPLPGNLLRAANIFGIAVLIATGILIYLIVRKEPVGSTVDQVKPINKLNKLNKLNRLTKFRRELASGFRKMGRSGSFYQAFLVTPAVLLFQAIGLWLMMDAYGIKRSFLVAAVVFLIINLSSALPSAPANLGTYQFFCVVGLTFFGVDKTLATGFSIAVFILLLIPLLIIGLIAISQSGMTFSMIRHQIRQFTLG